MKKRFVLFLVLATFIVLPLSVSAAPVSFSDDDGDGVYENDAAISMGQFGNIEEGDMTWEYTDEEAGEKTWTISFVTSHQYIYFSLIPDALDIDSVVVSGTGFALLDQANAGDGMVDVMIESANNGGGEVTITVITYDNADEGCQLSVSPLNLDCSVQVSGLYFDNSGNVITAEEYAEVCGNVTPDDPNDVPNSQTGSVIPYIAIGGGLVAIALVYFLSKKANKVYKI